MKSLIARLRSILKYKINRVSDPNLGHRLLKTGRLVGFFLLPELKNLVMKKGAVFEDTLLEYWLTSFIMIFYLVWSCQNSFQKFVGIILRLTKKANSLHGIPVICQFRCFKRRLYFLTVYKKSWDHSKLLIFPSDL